MMTILPALPEMILSAGALFLLVFGAFKEEEKAWKPVLFASVGLLLLALWIILSKWGTVELAFGNDFKQDRFISYGKILLLGAALLVLLLSYDYTRHATPLPFEFPLLILLACIGMMVMLSAKDFIVFYLGLELQSLSLYILTAMRRDEEKSSEAGLKYFVLGAMASGLLLYGISLIYGFTGSVEFDAMAALYADWQQAGITSNAVLLGLIFVICGMCFKLSAAPFHMWTPDVYEGASRVIVAFFASAPKVAAMLFFTRLLYTTFEDFLPALQQVLVVIAVASMAVGSFAAIWQHNFKRMLAYSTIGHVGFMMAGVAAANVVGAQAVLIYMALYVLMAIGVFAALCMLHTPEETGTFSIASLAGLGTRSPAMALALAILMLSMAGIPFLAGFFGKFFVFLAVIESGMYFLAAIGVLLSVVAAFYYLRIIKICYFDTEKDYPDIVPCVVYKGGFATWILGASTVIQATFFLYPSALLGWAEQAAKVLVQ